MDPVACWSGPPTQAVVVGAGLAGAAVAARLAQEGWQVRVLDAADRPAAGASALPAGLVVPHVSPDDNLLAQLTRLGAQRTWELVQALLIDGQDYRRTGVRERRYDKLTGDPLPDRWHAHAGWIKPPRLIQALLARPGVIWQGQSRVASLARCENQWRLLAKDGHCLAMADLVVLCAGFDSHALTDQRYPLQALRGQVSWAIHDPTQDPQVFGPIPTNGAGNLIPWVPTDRGAAWYLGSTFDRDNTDATPRQADHQSNWNRLQKLAPLAAQATRNQFENHSVQAFCAIRCAARDRMPVVGPVDPPSQPAVWVSTAMGARGLTLAPLCADVLVAQLHGQQLPIDGRLARAMQTQRKALRRPLHPVNQSGSLT